MAELVDALVSNTSGRNAVPVRSRLRVLLSVPCPTVDVVSQAGIPAPGTVKE